MMTMRLFTGCGLLAACLCAAPPLTTVQDVLYKADGTRFSGTVTISWSSFEAIDRSAIATQSTTVKVADGVLRVQLVPTTSSTPPIYYTVRYNSDGRVQFEEKWSVPSTAQPVRLRDVRVIASGVVAPDISDPLTGPVQESDVVGLIADLAARPLKGPGYAAGRVVLVNNLGALESATGTPTDCVRVDGSSGPCGSSAPSFVDADALSGIIDGSNSLFSITSQPDPVSSLAVYRNGILQKAGVDYTAAERSITFLSGSAPQPGDILVASYRIGGAVSGTAQFYPTPQVLCSGTGAATNSVAFESIGTCAIPAGLLSVGDRVELRFDLEHQGTSGEFSFELLWGDTGIAARTAAATETMVSGRAAATIKADGARVSHESWGTELPFSAGVTDATDNWADGVTIDIRAKMSQPGETLTLNGYTVVRFP